MIQFIKQGRFLALMFMLLGCLAIQASDDLITKQITIKLDKAGTLPDKVTTQHPQQHELVNRTR